MTIWSFVVSLEFENMLKKSKWFNHTLGLSITKINGKGGDRVLNEVDGFSYYFTQKFKTSPYLFGSIGTMNLYRDFYIKDHFMIFIQKGNTFIDFVKDFNDDVKKQIKENSIDWFLGNLISELKNEIDKPILKNVTKINTEYEGDKDKLKNNPGAVNWKDIEKWMKEKDKNRWSGSN